MKILHKEKILICNLLKGLQDTIDKTKVELRQGHISSISIGGVFTPPIDIYMKSV